MAVLAGIDSRKDTLAVAVIVAAGRAVARGELPDTVIGFTRSEALLASLR